MFIHSLVEQVIEERKFKCEDLFHLVLVLVNLEIRNRFEGNIILIHHINQAEMCQKKTQK